MRARSHQAPTGVVRRSDVWSVATGDQPGGAKNSNAMLSGSRNDNPDPYPASTIPPLAIPSSFNPRFPLPKLGTVSAREREVVQTDPPLIEWLASGGVGKLMKAHERLAEKPDNVAKRSGVLIEDGLRPE